MTVRPLLTLTRIELALVLREPAAVGFTLLLPLLLLALNGGDNSPVERFGGIGVVDVMVPGLIVYVIATSAVMVLPETLATYRDSGILRRLRVSPLRAWQVLCAHAGVHSAMALVGAVVLVSVGTVAFDLRGAASIPAVLLALVLSLSSVLALGFLLAALAPTARTAQAVAAGLYFPAIFVSGAAMPRAALPETAQRIGDVLPLTYATQALQDAWHRGTVDAVAVAVLLATTVVAGAVALRTFRWEARR